MSSLNRSAYTVVATAADDDDTDSAAAAVGDNNSKWLRMAKKSSVIQKINDLQRLCASKGKIEEKQMNEWENIQQ